MEKRVKVKNIVKLNNHVHFMNWLKSTFCIARLNVDSDAKLTDGGNPLRLAKKIFFPNIIDTSWLKQFVCVTSCVCCMIKLKESINVHTH